MSKKDSRAALSHYETMNGKLYAAGRTSSTRKVSIHKSGWSQARNSRSLDYSRFYWQKKKRCSKRLMNTGF
jgi:hypothetical protein